MEGVRWVSEGIEQRRKTAHRQQDSSMSRRSPLSSQPFDIIPSKPQSWGVLGRDGHATLVTQRQASLPQSDHRLGQNKGGQRLERAHSTPGRKGRQRTHLSV